MNDIIFYGILLACAGVLIVLALGMGSFAKGGKESGKFGNKMMRYRLIAQFVAIVLIVLLVWLRGTGEAG